MAAVRSGDAAAVVELRCETDFVAKSAEFVALADELAALVAAKGEDAVGELDDEIDGLRSTLKENISVGTVRPPRRRGAGRWSTPTSTSRPAAASTPSASCSRAAARSWPTTSPCTSPSPSPTYLSRDDVPADEVAAERATLETISRNEGKPEAALEKIVDGRMNGWFKERVLLDQSYVRDEKQTIAAMLGSARIVAVRAGRRRRLRR